MSRDDFLYEWLGAESKLDAQTFRMAFKESDDKVYFRLSFPYQLHHFERWAHTHAAHPRFKLQTLCDSEKNRNIPLAWIGDPQDPKLIVLAARHHACESVASYVLEGVADELIRQNAALHSLGIKVLLVPFINLDGVEDGDQGKSRIPHDHNRDYIDAPIYQSIRALTTLLEGLEPLALVDFHCPWIFGGTNDYPSLVKANPEIYTELERFGEILKRLSHGEIIYDGLHDVRAGEDWLPASPTQSTATAFALRLGAKLALTLEFPYFGAEVTITQNNALAFGRQFGQALLKYFEE